MGNVGTYTEIQLLPSILLNWRKLEGRVTLEIPTFFFLNSVLHKVLKKIKSENILVAWNYPEESRIHYDFSLVKKNYQKAYTIREVSELVEISEKKIRSYLDRKLVQHPSGKSYTIHNRKPNTYYWSEDDVLDLRDQLYNLVPKNKYGEPTRKYDLISKAELLSKMRGDQSYYVKAEDGRYIRVWKAV